MIKLFNGQLAQLVPDKSQLCWHFDGPATISSEGEFGRGANYMFYVYAFYDKIRKVFYVGCTNDLKRRVKEHMLGKTHTTYRMVNKLLVYYEACLSKKDAEGRERQLKTGFGRGYLKRRLKNYLMGS